MKRIKQVFKNDQLCHVWTHQTQDFGRSNTGRMFFEKTKIYSYGYHYCAATIYPNHGNVVLINEHRYSMQTGMHLGAIENATSHLKRFYVSHPDDIIASLDEKANQLTTALFDVFSQLKPYIDLNTHFDEYNELCEIFNKPKLKLSIPSDLRELIVEHLRYRDQRNDVLNQKTALKKRRQDLERERARRLARFNIDIEEQQREIRERLAEKQELRDWLSGKLQGYGYYYTDIDLIRVNGNRVETTGGAEVPLSHAIKLLRALDAGIDVTGKKVGHFTVDSVELVNNRIEIGCHTIPLGQARKVLKPYLSHYNNVIPLKNCN